MSRLPSELTPTSYAALGQLALRPWTIYEMTKNIARTLRWFWPRAESGIYREVKLLHRRGLVKRTEVPGRRGRPATRYEISPEGLVSLAAWLGTEPAGWNLHSEPLLRLHLAPYGTKADLVRAIGAARAQALELLDTAAIVGEEFAQGRHQFQQQVHIRALLFDYLATLGTMTLTWADRCLAEIEQWDDLDPSPEQIDAAVDQIREHLTRLR